MIELHEYAFEIKLFAAVRIVAASEETARSSLDGHLDLFDLTAAFRDRDASIFVTEALLHVDDEAGPCLFEIDREEID